MYLVVCNFVDCKFVKLICFFVEIEVWVFLCEDCYFELCNWFFWIVKLVFVFGSVDNWEN